MSYQLIVGNIGTVHASTSLTAALLHFREYQSQSESGIGRAGGENVTLLKHGEPVKEFIGTIERNQTSEDL